jgi:hypothetical protein
VEAERQREKCDPVAGWSRCGEFRSRRQLTWGTSDCILNSTLHSPATSGGDMPAKKKKAASRKKKKSGKGKKKR